MKKDPGQVLARDASERKLSREIRLRGGEECDSSHRGVDAYFDRLELEPFLGARVRFKHALLLLDCLLERGKSGDEAIPIARSVEIVRQCGEKRTRTDEQESRGRRGS